MNKYDQKELKKRLQSTEFRQLFGRLVDLRGQIMLVTKVATRTPTARELKTGKQPEIFAVVNPGQNGQEIEAQLKAIILAIIGLARRMSAFFPESRRWHWQEIFISQALGSSGIVEQEQRGGRPKGVRPSSVRQKYLRITNFRYSRAWIWKTDEEFLEAYPNCKLSELKRAKKWYSEGKP